MRTPLLLSFLILFMGTDACFAAEPMLPAFPGAQGYGAEAIGGRGGRVIEVTHLDDSGHGSFRAAVTARGRRTVVFRVGGIIELKSRIDIAEPYLTVAGQTAPGGGVTLKGTAEGGGQMLRIRTHDVILRHLRIRSGAYGKPGRGQVNVSLDPLEARGERYGNVYNIMLDHLSLSWTLDENIAVFRNVPGNDAARDAFPIIRNVSVQRCLIAEGLYPHSTGLQSGGERVMKDGRSVFNGGHGVSELSIHRNLFATNSHRNPGLGCKSAALINNVMYNWSSKCAETHDAIAVDWIGNYFKPGPLSDPKRLIVHNAFFKGFAQHRFDPPSIYMAGNRNAADPRQADWQMYSIHYEDKPLPDECRRERPLAAPKHAVRVVSAERAYETVLGDVGANVRLNQVGEWEHNSDAADRRIFEDVLVGRGEGTRQGGNRVHYTHPDQVGGYPKIDPGVAYADADHDGMPDAWEKKHGLPADKADDAQDVDRDGYTNLEEFLNGTDPKARDK
jgi:hypothetical protein